MLGINWIYDVQKANYENQHARVYKDIKNDVSTLKVTENMEGPRCTNVLHWRLHCTCFCTDSLKTLREFLSTDHILFSSISTKYEFCRYDMEKKLVL